MIRHLLVLLTLSIFVVACGVKTDLVTPSGKQTKSDQHDPSKPPHPLGR